MLAKPSPLTVKMLKAIDDYFNTAFDNNKYSLLFRKEYTRLFIIEQAEHFPMIGSDGAYMAHFGFIDSDEFEKNINLIEQKISELVKDKENAIRHLEDVLPYAEKDRTDGILSNDSIDVIYRMLESARNGEESITNPYIHLPLILKQLKGDASNDYQIVKKKILTCLSLKTNNTCRPKRTDTSDLLYQQLSDWIDLITTEQQYGKSRQNAMRKKLALKGKKWFNIACISNFESAKRFITEVFYPDQEEYYQQLEKWAENEIDDKKCSNWISNFLLTGRTMSVKNVQVLRFKGDYNKGKKFLLSKYKAKINWEKKRIQERESRHLSLFDTYDKYYNSFQEICTNIENKYMLFPISICSNIKEEHYPSMSIFSSWKSGIRIQQDTLTYSLFVKKMTLSSTNRYFYTYISQYRGNAERIIIYSDEGFNLIKEYIMAINPEVKMSDNIVGCITIIDYTSGSNKICTTAFLSYLKENHIGFQHTTAHHNGEWNCLASKGFQNKVGYRVFTNAAIYHIAKRLGVTLRFTLEETIPDNELQLLLDSINIQYEHLSFEDRYLCHFIDCTRYKFPSDKEDKFNVFRSSRRLNLFHDVQHHFSTTVFNEWQFPCGKIVYQYKNNEFVDNINNVGKDFYKYKDGISVWMDKSDKLFLFNLRTLLYLNWAFVNSHTGKIKKLSTLWLFRILYSNCLDSFQKDKAFFSSLLYYTLIQNERIFIIIIEKILTTLKGGRALTNMCRYDSISIFYNIVRFYSNDFKGWGKEMTYDQIQFLNNGKRKHDLLKLFIGEHKKCSNINEADVLDFAERLFDYVVQKLINDKFPHDGILYMLKDMKPFDIPDNFKRKNDYYSQSFVEYNGDYSGTYVHDVMGYSNDDIDEIFDGDPDAYWNID